jgi:hypothetical protein
MKGRRIKSIAVVASPQENFAAKKLEKALSDFFALPVLSLKEAINREFDAAIQVKINPQKGLNITFILLPELVEVGPQIIVSHAVWS